MAIPHVGTFHNHRAFETNHPDGRICSRKPQDPSNYRQYIVRLQLLFNSIGMIKYCKSETE